MTSKKNLYWLIAGIVNLFKIKNNEPHNQKLTE